MHQLQSLPLPWDILRHVGFTLEYTSVESDEWLEHAAFARLLIAETRPQYLVELGATCGNSYFAFCQAVRDFETGTRCHAVSAWQNKDSTAMQNKRGDVSAMFTAVNAYNRKNYDAFSRILRQSPDEARSSFAPESIDVLHLNGLQSYSEARRVFASWVEAVRPGGFVLIHGANEFNDAMGVNCFWDEMSAGAPEQHLFRHDKGLGVWRKPGGEPLSSAFLCALMQPNTVESGLADAYCTVLGERAALRAQVTSMPDLVERELKEQKKVLEKKFNHSRTVLERKITAAKELLLQRERYTQVEVNRARQEVDKILQSRSWKVTVPLRAFGALTRRLMGKAADGMLSPLASKMRTGSVDIRKVLVMDVRIPRRENSAGERATWGIVSDFVALGYDVSYLPNNMAYDGEYASSLENLGVKIFTNADGYDTPADFLRQYGADYGVFYLVRVEVTEAVLQLIRSVAPGATVFFHDPDLGFVREMREAEVLNDPLKMVAAEESRVRELSCMRKSDCTVIISESERQEVLKYLPNSKISVFPGLYAEVVPQPEGYSERKDMFFLGGFGHPPNTDAVVWFVKNIWPLVREKLPDAHFYVVGSGMSLEIFELEDEPGVVLLGFVKDLSELFSTIRLGVAPLRFGAGIKGKVAMTLGAGVPCVCTTVAAEGMNLIDGYHTRIADTEQAFADAVVEMYQNEDLWTSMSKRSQEQVDAMFSEQANRKAFINVLHANGCLPLKLWAEYCDSMIPKTLPSVPEEPDVSIIIPVYNKWELTATCINSVHATCSGKDISYEIILADDCSTDNTRNAKLLYPGIRHVVTPENMGFLRNCNHAAATAKGRHILLLNNDTVVMPGWLQSLYAHMQDESVGVAGSLLVFPDSIVQEVGGIVWNDASAWNYGRGSKYEEQRGKPAREADYVSGASLLIRGSLWRELDGFDLRYRTAYYEDTDLCMAARNKGLKVMVIPTSVVIHFEHMSYGESGETVQNELMRHNGELFREKWAEDLKKHYPAGSSPDLAANRGSANAAELMLHAAPPEEKKHNQPLS